MSAAEPRFRPSRPLGRTGSGATRLGAGDLADRQVPIETCVRTLVRALDAGLNVVDTAPAYEDGYSEQIVGRALRARRDSVFLIDKIDHLHEAVAPQVAGSLSRLGLTRALLQDVRRRQGAGRRTRSGERAGAGGTRSPRPLTLYGVVPFL